jgi:hypothetical protein
MQSTEQMLEQIREIEAEKERLETELEVRRYNARIDFVERIRAEMTDLGMSADDLIRALGGKAVAKITPIKSRKVRAARALKADPSKVYLGGALPHWLKDAMFTSGYNPEDKDRRRQFIDEHMQAA